MGCLQLPNDSKSEEMVTWGAMPEGASLEEFEVMFIDEGLLVFSTGGFSFKSLHTRMSTYVVLSKTM